MRLNTEHLSAGRQRAFALAAPALGFSAAPEGAVLTGGSRESGLALTRTETGWQLDAAGLTGFVRGLGLLAQHRDAAPGWVYEEQPWTRSLGVMVDCSRNAVPTPAALQRLFVRLALMGYDTVQLYTEDTYAIPEQPYFGYLRGAYTREELRALDDFAAALGIELVPCVQTLAHLAQPLRWQPFAPLWDCDDILLCEAPETEAFLEQMFAALADTFRSRKVNIGMDEAHMLGLGRYLDRHGYRDRPAILRRHLETVLRIARQQGFAPMMWSDMFFRLANGGEYYAADKPLDPAAAAVPEGLTLVYWDYYSEDGALYHKMMARHKELCPDLVFAGGAWKWTGFVPHNRFSLKLAELAAVACRAEGVDQVLITCWGDNGAEASVFSVLPALSVWAERAWAGRAEEDWLDARFAACCGAPRACLLALDDPDMTPDNPAPGRQGVNPTKYLLYQDVLLGLADADDRPEQAADHFAACAARLGSLADEAGEWDGLLRAEAALCRLLARKAPLGRRLRAAWQAKDRAALAGLAAEIPEILELAEAFRQAYHAQWLAENKPFGLEAFDIRLGGVCARLRTAADRLESWLNGRCDTIPELDAALLPFAPRTNSPEPFSAVRWEQIAAPCALYGV